MVHCVAVDVVVVIVIVVRDHHLLQFLTTRGTAGQTEVFVKASTNTQVGCVRSLYVRYFVQYILRSVYLFFAVVVVVVFVVILVAPEGRP